MNSQGIRKLNDYFTGLAGQEDAFVSQVCLFLNQEEIHNQCYGSRVYSRESPMLWMSAGKPLTAAMLLSVIEKQRISLETPVSEFLPPFASKGKESITLFHLLTHTGGFRGADMGLHNVPFDQAVSHVCQTKLEPGWIPGQKAGYHINSAWILLAAILEELCEDSFIHLFRHFTDSAGLKNTQCQRVEDGVVPVYNSASTPIKRERRFNHEFFQTVRSGSNITGPASDLAQFYQHLLNAPEMLGLSGTFRDAMVSRQRSGMTDATFRAQMDWGLGVIVNTGSDVPYSFGPHASPHTVGHGGSQCSLGFMDIEKNVTGAVIFNDMPGETRHQKRMTETMTLLYEVLALTP